MVALDTGFFVAFMRGSKEASALWHGFRESKIRPFISVLTVGELAYVLRREGREEEADAIMDKIGETTRVVDVDTAVVLKGAEMKQRHGMPFVDSLICATAVLNGCETLYTSDRKHMKGLKAYGLDAVFVRE